MVLWFHTITIMIHEIFYNYSFEEAKILNRKSLTNKKGFHLNDFKTYIMY